MDKETIQEATIIITGDFDEPADRDKLPSDPEENLNMIREWLTNRIAYMVEKDLQGLLVILYRIDVNEYKAKTLLAENDTEQGPAILAELILQRQIAKAKTRIEYRIQRDARSSTDDDGAERW